jgi:hypothetical protein
MNTQRDDELDRRIEKAAASLPLLDPPATLWRSIEAELLPAQQHTHRPSHDGFLLRLRWRLAFLAQPRWTYAAYSMLLVAGLAVSIYLVAERSHSNTDLARNISSEQLLTEARDDIDQAMFFYERAIAKLSVLAEQNEHNLEPGFVALQKEKIRSLRSAIVECKTALHQNRYHPDVQQYLLTAYVDLQSTLQEMATRKN